MHTPLESIMHFRPTAVKSLLDKGVTSIEQACAMSDEQLLELRNVGRKFIARMRDYAGAPNQLPSKADLIARVINSHGISMYRSRKITTDLLDKFTIN